jgi:cytochrome c-type biogenesis protein CcmH/NrfF
MTGPLRRWLPWVTIAVLVVSALVIAVLDDEGPATDADQARRIAATIRCPTCRGQSVLESDAPTARAIRDEIDRRIAAGETGREIRAYLVSVHGREILLNPPRSGVAGLVWVLPVAAMLAALAGLALTFHRWQARPVSQPTAGDRALVESARRQTGGDP